MAGEPAADHVPERPHTWRRWNEVASLFTGPEDPNWDADRDAIESGPSTPPDD